MATNMTNMGELQGWFQAHYDAECDIHRREEMRIPGPVDGIGQKRFGVSFGYAGGQVRVRAMVDRNWIGTLDLPVNGRLVEGGRREDDLRLLMFDCLGLRGHGFAVRVVLVGAEPAHRVLMRWDAETDRMVIGR